MKPYPIFLVGLEHRRSVVIGGGHEAERKVGELLGRDANVVLIAEHATELLSEWAASGRVSWTRRAYRERDLRDAFVVIVTDRDDPALAGIVAEARDEKALISVMDDTEHCQFVAGSVVWNDPLLVSISTSGCAPALAVRLRQRLERELGVEYAEFLKVVAPLRETMTELHPDPAERRRRWYALVDSNVLDLLRDGRVDDARRRIDEIVGGVRSDLAT